MFGVCPSFGSASFVCGMPIWAGVVLVSPRKFREAKSCERPFEARPVAIVFVLALLLLSLLALPVCSSFVGLRICEDTAVHTQLAIVGTVGCCVSCASYTLTALPYRTL